PLHRGRRSASRLRLSLPACLQSVPVPLPSLPAALQSWPESLPGRLQSVAALVAPLPARVPSLPAQLLSFSALWLHRRRVASWACRQAARRHFSATVQVISVGSWLLLFAFAVAKVHNPFLDVAVVRNQSGVRLVMLQRA